MRLTTLAVVLLWGGLVLAAGCASSEAPPTESSPTPGGSPTTESSPPPAFDPSQPLTVEDCVKVALASSLTARSFEARIKAAHGAAEAAATWPNPMVEWNVEDLGTVLNRERQLVQQELVHYPLFFWWTKGLEADVARADEARAAASVEDDRRLLRLEIGRAYYELLATDESVKNYTEAVQIATRLAEATQKRLALGDASRLDASRARAEALDARRDLAKAVRDRTVDGISFALALGAERPVPVTLATGWPGELPAEVATASTESLVARALENRPDVRESEATALKATKALSLEERKTIPLAEWQVAGGASQGPEGYGAIFNLQATLPVFDWNGGNKTRARAELESALVDLAKTRRAVGFEVESALVAFSHSRETLEQFARPIRDAREEDLEASRKLFAAGEVSYVDLLQAQRDAVAARRALVDAEKDAALARHRLLIALGRD
jgi:cobalt-zinc-cadmium efflux system outer membrane protein